MQTKKNQLIPKLSGIKVNSDANDIANGVALAVILQKGIAEQFLTLMSRPDKKKESEKDGI